VAKLFPTYAGAVLASLSGAFQIAGLVYLVVTRLFSSRRVGFLLYAGLVLMLAVVAMWLLPRGLPSSTPMKDSSPPDDSRSSSSSHKDQVNKSVSIQRARGRDDPENGAQASTAPASTTDPESMPIDHRPLDATTTNTNLVATETTSVTRTNSKDTNEQTSEVAPRDSCDNNDNDGTTSDAVHSESDNTNSNHILPPQIWNWKYFGLLQWFSLVITPLQYYVGSIGFQLENKGDETGKYSDIYSILYGCAAILSPALGYMSDRFTLGIAHAIPTALCAVSFFFLMLDDDMLPLHWQTVGLACNAVGRMGVFSTFFAHIGSVFGYRYFGALAGLGLLTSAIVSLLQYPLLAAADNGHATLVNGLCGALLTAELLYCAWLHVKT
jgi:hypothetical protein